MIGAGEIDDMSDWLSSFLILEDVFFALLYFYFDFSFLGDFELTLDTDLGDLGGDFSLALLLDLMDFYDLSFFLLLLF